MDYEFNLIPIGKPRMTQRDKWLNPPRPEILKYRLSKHAIQTYALMNKFVLGETLDGTFILPMPNSWSKKKKVLMCGKPHLVKPDLDNIIKFVQDSLKPEGDQMIHTIVANKIWGEEGKIILRQHDNSATDSPTHTELI